MSTKEKPAVRWAMYEVNVWDADNGQEDDAKNFQVESHSEESAERHVVEKYAERLFRRKDYPMYQNFKVRRSDGTLVSYEVETVTVPEFYAGKAIVCEEPKSEEE